MGSKGADPDADLFRQLRLLIDQLLEEDACLTLRDLAVNGKDLMALGIPPGKQLGQCLQWLLDGVLDEALPNDKATLLEAAKSFLTTEEVSHETV